MNIPVSTAVARYTLAVDRKFKRDGEESADFIGCVAFGRRGEFAERYFHQGIKIVVTGRIQTGSYTNKDGVRAYTTDVVVEDQEFAESKSAGQQNAEGIGTETPKAGNDGFMDASGEDELPFA